MIEEFDMHSFAYLEGQAAYLRGEKTHHNPFEDSEEEFQAYADWREGWYDAAWADNDYPL
jgi:hypothetical protein